MRRLADGREHAEADFGAAGDPLEVFALSPSKTAVGCGGLGTHSSLRSISRTRPQRTARCDEDRSHSESHIVELDDGSRWQIFPG